MSCTGYGGYGARHKKRKKTRLQSPLIRVGDGRQTGPTVIVPGGVEYSTRLRVSRDPRDDHGPCRPVCFPPTHLLKYTMPFLRFSDPKNCLCSITSSHLPARTATGRVIMYRPTHTSIMCLRKLFG